MPWGHEMWSQLLRFFSTSIPELPTSSCIPGAEYRPEYWTWDARVRLGRYYGVGEYWIDTAL